MQHKKDDDFFSLKFHFVVGVLTRTLMNKTFFIKKNFKSGVEIFGLIVSSQNLDVGIKLSFDHGETKLEGHNNIRFFFQKGHPTHEYDHQ